MRHYGSNVIFFAVWRVAWALGVLALVMACEGSQGDAGAADALPDGMDAAMEGEGSPLDGSAEDADGSAELLDAADSAAPPDGAGATPPDAGLFVHGCPIPGQAMALEVTNDAFRLDGESALGGPGDFLLANEHAAFVVQSPEVIKTYWYYGGIVIDAVSVSGCGQAGPEQFDELAILVGAFDAGNLPASVLRGFRADTVEVLADGSDGGAAIVRATGTDDVFWLIELELMKALWVSQGVAKGYTSPLGLEIVVDYILEPDSPVLRAEVHVRNLDAFPKAAFTAIAVWFGDTTRDRFYANSKTSIAGFGLELGLGWLAASSVTRDGAIAVSMEADSLASVEIAGVRGLFDFSKLLAAPLLGAAGTPGDTSSNVVVIAAGPRDSASAVGPLAEAYPELVADLPLAPTPLQGSVVDESGQPLGDAVVALEVPDANDDYVFVDALHTRADGSFSGVLPLFAGGAPTARLRVSAPGRTPWVSEPFIGLPAEPVELALGAASAIAYEVFGSDGLPIPASIQVFQQGQRVVRHDTAGGSGRLPLPPGDYEVSVTRGYEYRPLLVELAVGEGESVPLRAVMERVVDTAGYLSMDSHVHAGPSADSAVRMIDRFVNAAAEGLEVVIHTDHEVIRDYGPAYEASGMQQWVASIIGEEVTAPVPEHTNAYPLPLMPDHPRGAPVDWRGLTIGEVYAAERARGAEVVALNHPRGGSCNYLCLIGWDRERAVPTLEDPSVIGLPTGAELWSWDFDSFELMNGSQRVYLDPAKPERSGLFDDWMSFLNHGHTVTATGVSDVHGLDSPGTPRNYFVSSTDDPAELDVAELVSSVVQGRVVVSLGAFVRVEANGAAHPGDLLAALDGKVDLHVHVEAPEAIDVTYVQVFANCDQVAHVESQAPHALVKHDETFDLDLEQDAHLVVMAFGDELLPRGLEWFDPRGVPRVVANAIYVDVDGNGVFDPPGDKGCLYTAGPPGP